MVAIDMQPLSIVEDMGFRELLSVLVPQYEVPSRGTILKRIQLLHSEMETSIRHKLINVDEVAFTTDNWTSRHNEAYVTVTVHFLDTDWNLHSYVLETTTMPERHTADNLSERINDITEEWELTNKLIAVVHDNASNIVKAMRSVDSESVLCSAHTLQLAVNKGLEHQAIAEIISKASAIIGHFSHSTVAVRELEKRQKQLGIPIRKLIQCVKTRWNSVFFMLERLLEQKTAIVAVLNDASVTPAKKAVRLEVKQQEWQIIGDLVKSLRPLQMATTTLCADQNVSISSVLPVTLNLVKKFLKLEVYPEESEFIANFKMKVAAEISRRFNLEFENYVASPITLAPFLDPRFKNLSFLPEAVKSRVLTAVSTLLTEKEGAPLNSQITNPSALDFLLGEENENEAWSENGQAELKRYKLEQQINRNEDPLQWWKHNSCRYPCVGNLARKYLCIPAISASSERTFSTSGNIVSGKRSCLSSDTVRSLVFLHQNIEKSYAVKVITQSR